MDIERHDFDTRNECETKREQVGKGAFEKDLENTWGAEAPRQESKFRRDFWVGALITKTFYKTKQILFVIDCHYLTNIDFSFL